MLKTHTSINILVNLNLTQIAPLAKYKVKNHHLYITREVYIFALA